MRPLKLRHLSLLFVLVLVLGSWLGRALLAEQAIKSTLKNFGLTDTITEIQQLGLSSSLIPRFGFVLTTETGRFQLEALDISIDYSPTSITDGRVNNLAIGKLLINYDAGDPVANNQTAVREVLEPLKILAALRQGLRNYIISDSFSVQQAILAGETFGVLHDKPLQLSGSNVGGTTYAELTLIKLPPSEQQAGLRKLVFTRLSDDVLAAELRITTAPGKTPATIEFNIHDTSIDGNYVVDPALLSRWLQPLTDISHIDKTEQVNGTLSIDLAADDQIKTVITASSTKLEFNAYRADNLSLQLVLNNPHTNPFQNLALQKNSYIKADNFSYQDFALGNTRMNLVGDLSATENSWYYKGGLSTDKISVNYQSKTLLLKDIASRVSASPESLELHGDFSTASIPGKFDFTLVHSFTRASGNLSIKPLDPIDLNTENHKLSQLITPWPYEFDLFSGDIKLTTQANWSNRKDFALTTRITLDQAGGNYGELVFSGLSFDHELEILPALRSIDTSKIKLAYMDSGVSVSNISTDFTLEKANTGPLPQLLIQGLYGEIFGGIFSGEDFFFDLNRSTNSFKIKAANIDLAKIVETQQLEDIRVTGRVDGTIPVEISEQGIFIEHGAFLNNIRTGTIRYNPASGTDQLKQNPITGIALDALRDFHYSHLSADVNFTPEGMLTINLQLKGTSPELDTTRPVHLNINTEQNLLSLLKSLRYAEGISANIDKIVRRQYEKSGSNNQAE